MFHQVIMLIMVKNRIFTIEINLEQKKFISMSLKLVINLKKNRIINNNINLKKEIRKV